jgi:hypothetical protein
VTTVSGGFSVTIDDLAVSATTFERLHRVAAGGLVASAGGLGAAGGMAGDDAVLARWRDVYDPLAAAVWAAGGTASRTLSDIAARLAVTGNGYLDADRASGGGATDRIAAPAGPASVPPPPPSSTGPVGPGVPAPLAAYWPGGDPGMLRDAAAAWSGLATALDDAAHDADSAFRSLVGTNEGATFSAMRAYWGRHFQPCGTAPLFNAVPGAARALGGACGQLADAIDVSRAEVGRAAIEAAEALSEVDVPAHVLGRFTRGATDVVLAVGKAALTGKFLDAYRDRYLADVDRLVAELLRIDRPHLEVLAAPPAPQPAVDVGLSDVGDVVGLGLTGSAWDGIEGDHPGPDSVHLTPQGRTHILVGDDKGGGHLSGRGIPGKSEFPPSWTPERIVVEVLAAARGPDRTPVPGRDDCWVVEGVRDGVRIRVIVGEAGEIVTAYPRSGPGVIQNPRR